jgi:hypothetical protein
MNNKFLPLGNQISFISAIVAQEWALQPATAQLLKSVLKSLEELKELKHE